MPCVWWNPFIAFWDIWGMFQHFVQISLRTQEFWVDDRSLFVHCNCSYNLERAIRGGGWFHPRNPRGSTDVMLILGHVGGVELWASGTRVQLPKSFDMKSQKCTCKPYQNCGPPPTCFKLINLCSILCCHTTIMTIYTYHSYHYDPTEHLSHSHHCSPPPDHHNHGSTPVPRTKEQWKVKIQTNHPWMIPYQMYRHYFV